MAPNSPAKIADKPESQGVELVEPGRIMAADTTLPELLLKALAERGYKLPEVKRRAIPFFWKIAWEELCTLRTPDPKVWSSPLTVVTGVTAFPDAEQVFDDYQGFIRAEFFAEDGEPYAISHAYCYKATGELTPLSEWLTREPPPFYARFGFIETRKEGRHVVRPLPLDIEIR